MNGLRLNIFGGVMEMFMKRSTPFAIMLTFFSMNCLPAFALPQGENVIAGEASFDRPAGDVLNVRQQTDKLIANYDSFSIGANETVNFLQPSAASAALNRVVGADPSSILGHLTATGKIFLINPNGILFGPTAHVDTAGLVASTLDIRNEDFWAGRYQFFNAGGNVVNRGYITTPGGYVALLGSQVENTGVIEAQLGSVALASGKAMTLNLDPQGLISVVIDEPTEENLTNTKAAVKNSGKISAEGGRVVLTTQSLGNAVQNSVNNSGVISANSLVERNGEILLVAQGGGSRVVNDGSLDVSARQAGIDGGFIELSADHLDLTGGNLNTASVDGKSGTILLDPVDFTIDDAFANLVENQNGSNLSVSATNDVNFQLSDNLLELVHFDTEKFSVHAGHDINQNGDRVVTHGGDVSFLSDQGNINLSAPIQTNGGNLDIEATAGDVVHSFGADVSTKNGDFRGKAGHDYIVKNGVTIDTDDGDVDIYAGRNIALGSPNEDQEKIFDWKYVGGTRLFNFREFGYYYFNQGHIVYVPLAQGPNIGKDGTSPTSGSGLADDNVDPLRLYTIFNLGNNKRGSTDNSGLDTWRFHTDKTLNGDGFNHVKITGNRYGWEDIFGLGDRDFDDAELDFEVQEKIIPPGVTISSNHNVFLSADQGSISQTQGVVQANNLVLSSNQGTTGASANSGIFTDVNNISALNKTSGDIRIDNKQGMNIKDLTALTGLNENVVGQNGVTNNASGDKINVLTDGDLLIDARIRGKGDIDLHSTGDIEHTSRGDVTIDNSLGLFLNPPKDVTSPSRQVGTWSNDKTIDVAWRLPDLSEGCCGAYSAVADGAYTMAAGAKIVTDNGNATVKANGDAALSLIDAGNGKAGVTSHHGSIVDNDLGVTTTDFDVIGRNIQLRAPNGSIGGAGAGEEIDKGFPLSFSFVFDQVSNTNPDPASDAFTSTLDSNGDWLFATSFTTPADSDSWWFHVATVDEFHGSASSSVHLGPFLIDTTAPVITSGTPQGTPGPDGTFLSDVTVPFHATDNLSGFSPDGSLDQDLPPKTTLGIGENLTVTSDGVFDRAGNFAPGIPVSVTVVSPPGPPPPVLPPVTTGGFFSLGVLDNIFDFYRAYYEILSPSQFLSFEPATKIGLYAYHPLTETDDSAFDNIKLDAKAYEFIEDHIKLKKKLPDYFGQ